jgi:hypothetical protein
VLDEGGLILTTDAHLGNHLVVLGGQAEHQLADALDGVKPVEKRLDDVKGASLNLLVTTKACLDFGAVLKVFDELVH